MSGLHYYLRGAVGLEAWRRLGLTHVSDGPLEVRDCREIDAPLRMGPGTIFSLPPAPGADPAPVMEWRGPFVEGPRGPGAEGSRGEGIKGSRGRGVEGVEHSVPRPLESSAPPAHYWIGWPAHWRPPGPDELWDGQTVLDGRCTARIMLADRNEWSIPIVLPAAGGPGGLPRVYSAGRDGSFEGAEGSRNRGAEGPSLDPSTPRPLGPFPSRVQSRYEPVLAHMQRVLERYQAAADGQADVVIDEQEALEAAGLLLGVCYRVRVPELMALELLTPENLCDVVLTAIDAAGRTAALLPEPLRHPALERLTWGEFTRVRRAAGG